MSLPIVTETALVCDRLIPLKFQCVEILGVFVSPVIADYHEGKKIKWSSGGLNTLRIDDESVQDGSEVTVFYTAYFPNVIVTHFNNL